MDDTNQKARKLSVGSKTSNASRRGRRSRSNSRGRKSSTSAERSNGRHSTQGVPQPGTSEGSQFSPRKGSLEKSGSHETLGSIFINQIEDNSEDIEVLEGSPSALIVSHVPLSVFTNDSHKLEFESLFRAFNDEPQFLYLKSFSRARVEFNSPKAASRARAHVNNHEFLSCRLKVFFAQMPDSPGSQRTSRFLQVPKPHRQFLISPPASPPVGWEQVIEAEPVLNHDLLTALAHLAPGDKHELHEPEQSTHPAIVLHIASAEPSPDKLEVTALPHTQQPPLAGSKIQQTRCPPRAN